MLKAKEEFAMIISMQKYHSLIQIKIIDLLILNIPEAYFRLYDSRS